MSSGLDWRSAWESALSRSPYRAFSPDPSRAVEHWDRASRSYGSEAMDAIDEAVWEAMLGEGCVPGRGKVLDIGCGTGSLSARLGAADCEVLGLDISPGMVSRARERCISLPNVRFECQDWNAFSSGREFDLVLSSFCPAVDDLTSVLRMESMSRGRCCLVSSGGGADRLAFEVWGEIGHPGLSLEAFDPLFPYHALKEMGREPRLRSFRVMEEQEIGTEGMVEHMLERISLFQGFDQRTVSDLRDAIGRRAVDGVLTMREERTVSVLTWEALSARTAPW